MRFLFVFTIVISLLTVFVLTDRSPAPSVDEISVSDAWVRATPPGAKTAAVYLTINNPDADDALVAAETNVADEAQLHTHRHDDGMMRMQQVDRFELPGGETIELKPGGNHLMLIDIYRPMEPGNSIELRLIFEQNSPLTLQVPVRDGRTS